MLYREHARQRETFGVSFTDRQAIQWWIADVWTRQLYLPAEDVVAHAADKTDRGEDIPSRSVDDQGVRDRDSPIGPVRPRHATLGALGMTLELPLNALSREGQADADVRGTERGPSPRQSIARRVLGLRG